MHRLFSFSLACLLMLLFAFPLDASAQGALTRVFARRAASAASSRGVAARAFNRSSLRPAATAASSGRVALRPGTLRTIALARAPKLQPAWLRVRGNKVTLRGTHNRVTAASIRKGNLAHKMFTIKMKGGSIVRPQSKNSWQTGLRFKDPKTGKTVIPDAVTSRGRPIELKPNTPRGRRLGRSQLAAQERATGKKGRVLYY